MPSARRLIWKKLAPLTTVVPVLNLARGMPGLLAGVQQRDAGGVHRGHVHQVHRAVESPWCGASGPASSLVSSRLVQRRRRPRRSSRSAPSFDSHSSRSSRGGPEGDAGVVRGAAAQHLGAGVAHEGVAVLLRFDRVVPVVAGLQQLHPAVQLQHLGHAAVVRAGLHQGHGRRPGPRSAGRRRRPRRIRRRRRCSRIFSVGEVLDVVDVHSVLLAVVTNQPVTAGWCSGRCAWPPDTRPGRSGPSSRPTPDWPKPPHSACGRYGW